MITPKKIALGAVTAIAASLILSGCANKAAVDKDLSSAQTVNWSDTGASISLNIPDVHADSSDCDWSKTSVNPVVVVNTYSTDMTFSITINQKLAGNLNFFPAFDGNGAANLVGCMITPQQAGTQYIDVPANSNGTIVGYIAAGNGLASTLNEGGDNNVAIGAGGTQWYDFWLHINSYTNSFKNLELNYSHTGGLDATQNVQTGLFNGIDCSYDSTSGSLTIDSPATLTTPYTSNNPNAWEFDLNQPLCFGFFQAPTN